MVRARNHHELGLNFGFLTRNHFVAFGHDDPRECGDTATHFQDSALVLPQQLDRRPGNCSAASLTLWQGLMGIGFSTGRSLVRRTPIKIRQRVFQVLFVHEHQAARGPCNMRRDARCLQRCLYLERL